MLNRSLQWNKCGVLNKLNIQRLNTYSTLDDGALLAAIR